MAHPSSAYGGLACVVGRERDPEVTPEPVEAPPKRACLHLATTQKPAAGARGTRSSRHLLRRRSRGIPQGSFMYPSYCHSLAMYLVAFYDLCTTH